MEERVLGPFDLARHAFGTTNVVGRRLYVPYVDVAASVIVGVVGHVRHWGLAGDDQSRVQDQIYYPFAQVPDHLIRFFSTVMSLAVRTNGDPAAMIEPLRKELRGGGDQALYDEATMDQLVAASLEDYEALALKLARDRSYVAAVKDKLVRGRDTCPLFDTERFARNIEDAYLGMWQAYREGRPAASFAVAARRLSPNAIAAGASLASNPTARGLP